MHSSSNAESFKFLCQHVTSRKFGLEKRPGQNLCITMYTFIQCVNSRISHSYSHCNFSQRFTNLNIKKNQFLLIYSELPLTLFDLSALCPRSLDLDRFRGSRLSPVSLLNSELSLSLSGLYPSSLGRFRGSRISSGGFINSELSLSVLGLSAPSPSPLGRIRGSITSTAL